MTYKVLMADDDTDSFGFPRHYFKKLLDPVQGVFLEAYDGMQARFIINAEQPNVIIIDNQMPEFTGVEVIDDLQRRIARGKYPGYDPLMIIQSSDSEEDLKRKLHGDSSKIIFFQKPYNLDELVALVEKHMKKQLNI